MSYFGGLNNNKLVDYQFHLYSPDYEPLKHVGLASYTRNSLEEFGKLPNGQYDQELVNFFQGGAGGLINTLKCDGNYSLSAFNFETEEYEEVSGGDCFWTPSGLAAGNLLQFQSLWDGLQKNEIDRDSDLGKKMLYAFNRIATSEYGCLHSQQSLSMFGCAAESFTVKIHFFSAGNHSAKNKIAFNGMPTFVVEPKDAAGQRFAYQDTMNLPPGESTLIREGGPTNKRNSVAAELQYRYDTVTGKIECGTMQLLARLLGDLSGLRLPPISRNQTTFDYDSMKLKHADTCEAMTLQAHNGNPKQFGPTGYDCSGNKQKIKVVNLTPNNFKRGELVLCSLINGIWIPMGYGPPDQSPQQASIEWRDIQKYIVDSESFMRTEFLHADGPGGILNDQQYSSIIRHKFYSSMTNCLRTVDWASETNNVHKIISFNQAGLLDVDKINLQAMTTNSAILPDLKVLPDPGSIKPQYDGYAAVYDTDVMSVSEGGIRPVSLLRCTNAQYTPKQDGFVKSQDTTFSFGMYFSDGYKPASAARLLYNNVAAHSTLPGTIVPNGTVINLDNSIAPFTDIGKANWPGIDYEYVLAHFPAQLGIHGSGDRGILDADRMAGHMNVTATNAAGAWQGWRNYIEEQRHVSLVGADLSPVFNLVPNNPNKIQFNCLGTYSLLYGTTFSNTNASFYGIQSSKIHEHLKFQTTAGSDIRAPTFNEEGYGPTFWNLNSRANGPELYDFHIMEVPIPFGDVPYIGPSRSLKFRKWSTPSVAGGCGLFPQEKSKGGAYVYGVISARGTIKGANGVNFTVNNHWGLPFKPGSVSINNSVSVIGLALGVILQNTNVAKYNDEVYYGSASSDIDEPGTVKLTAKVYDHCETVVYDGRYNTPFFFSPDDERMDFVQVKAPPGATITNTNYNQDIFDSVTSTIRRGQMLNDTGFYYIKKVITVDGLRIVNGGTGYAVGDIITVTGAGSDAPVRFEVREVGPDGNITKYTKSELGNLSRNAFKNPDGLVGTVDSVGGSGAEIYGLAGTVVEKLMHDPAPVFHGEATLTPDDNGGYGPVANGFVLTTSTTSINFSDSEFNTDGLYDIFLMFRNDAGEYPENNNFGLGGILTSMDCLAQYLEVEITST